MNKIDPHKMKTDDFYQRIVKISAQPPYNRYALLAELHTDVVMRYLNTIRVLSRKRAMAPCADGRTVAQVVGHIAEWERFIILAAAEMVTGLEWPRIMDCAGYVELDGQVLDFSDVDHFNTYQATKHAGWPWEQIQEMAVHTATALHTLFTQPTILSPDSLQRTKLYTWRLPTGITLTIPVGWYLWMVAIEHEAVDHAEELGWE